MQYSPQSTLDKLINNTSTKDRLTPSYGAKPRDQFCTLCVGGMLLHYNRSAGMACTCVSSPVKLLVNSENKKKLFHRVEVKLMGWAHNMTDVSKCRQLTAWRAWWLWRCLYMLNDMQQMKGKCDWTAFPPGLNIKASPTGNIVNLPRLPPQWGTHSTMRGKWAKCTRPVEGSTHMCTNKSAHVLRNAPTQTS